eukprot:scaffold40438_cov37-Tisochrysis_lutea.AAC.4
MELSSGPRLRCDYGHCELRTRHKAHPLLLLPLLHFGHNQAWRHGDGPNHASVPVPRASTVNVINHLRYTANDAALIDQAASKLREAGETYVQDHIGKE